MLGRNEITKGMVCVNNEKFGTFMYFLTKDAAKYSFSEFLEECDISEEEYTAIKKHLETTYNIKLYV